MNKKILAVSILAVLMLVTISFATAISTNTTPTRKKETPLFGIRTRSAIEERLQNLKENIKARFIGERLFFLPFQLLKNVNDPYMARTMTSKSGTLCTEYSICNICN